MYMFIDICLIYIEIMFTARYPDATCEKHDTNGNLRLNKPKNQTSTKQKTPNFTYIVNVYIYADIFSILMVFKYKCTKR